MRIAIIGSGVSGLGAAWLLHRQHEITIYEKDARIGGHANTVEADFGDRRIPVDTGFIVFNDRNYPNLRGLFGQIDVPYRNSEMSFAVTIDDGRLEYGGGSIPQLFAQKRNLLRPRFLVMVRDILRFFSEAPALLNEPGQGPSLGEYLRRNGYSDGFLYDHLLPMAAAIWSCPVETMLDFPAASFARFFHNHGLLTVTDRPQWMTVTGGSREYISRLTAPFADRIRLGTPAVSVTRAAGGATVRDASGAECLYDQVIMACHADQSLALLADADPAEHSILGRFRYQPNEAVLHRDTALMPKRRAVWSSWNYLADGAAHDRAVAVTYWMNLLQGIDAAYPLFVTLNPIRQPDPAKVFARIAYEHPVFDGPAMKAQAELSEIQGLRHVWFCGAWGGYGFHEDGLKSGVAVARALGADVPWPTEVQPASHAWLARQPALAGE
ncbi:NAD(P)/FAD-dependent oxidoreductase [Oceanibaculum pacificum]|uniref:NADH-ubiquinone oxidoreductase subunit 6 n=1 Tax=Oceanibaculum pacificum TaxID=580166 RepID=A0A154VNG3_9PROT|nr:FAD-dependent oxidoreductase [Oceanibaculum pacificum]KZD02779.1 NADH-ubiquinone oxidoreductase subunit 6 [Oceanibaculum pacificum]